MCVICGGSVESGQPTPSDGVAFDCPKHGAFTIARAALPRFLRMPVREQEFALDRAKIFKASRANEVVVTSMDL